MTSVMADEPPVRRYRTNEVNLHSCSVRLCLSHDGVNLRLPIVIVHSHEGNNPFGCPCNSVPIARWVHPFGCPMLLCLSHYGVNLTAALAVVLNARWDQPPGCPLKACQSHGGINLWLPSWFFLIIHIVEGRTEGVVAEAAIKLKCAKLKAEEKRALTEEASLEQEWSPSTPQICKFEWIAPGCVLGGRSRPPQPVSPPYPLITINKYPCRPQTTIPRPSGQISIWEHLGKILFFHV